MQLFNHFPGVFSAPLEWCCPDTWSKERNQMTWSDFVFDKWDREWLSFTEVTLGRASLAASPLLPVYKQYPPLFTLPVIQASTIVKNKTYTWCGIKSLHVPPKSKRVECQFFVHKWNTNEKHLSHDCVRYNEPWCDPSYWAYTDT